MFRMAKSWSSWQRHNCSTWYKRQPAIGKNWYKGHAAKGKTWYKRQAAKGRGTAVLSSRRAAAFHRCLLLSCLSFPCPMQPSLCSMLIVEKKRKDYAFWLQVNEKPSIFLGCPECSLYQVLPFAACPLYQVFQVPLP